MNELQGLIVPVEARIDKLEKGLARANKKQRQAATQMERRAKQSANRLTATYGRAGYNIAASFGKLGPALLAGISVGAVSTATGRIRRVVGEVARIGDAAKTAGLDIEAFQELRYVSDQNRIDVDAMVDGLKELSLRADEFVVTGGGPAAEAFARLGFTATQLAEGLKQPDKLFEDIIEKMQDLDDAARIRISDEIFGGTAAEQFTALIDKGADALRETRQAARDAGAVLDAEVIRKAEELDRKFAALTTRMSNFGKALAVGIADASVKLVTLRTDLEDLTTTVERAESLLGEGTTVELSTDQGALDQHKNTVESIVSEYHRLAEAADQLTGPLFQSASTLAMFGETDASGEMNRIATEINTLVGDLNDGSISAETFEKRIQELATQAQTALAEVSAIDGVQFGNVTSALGGFVTIMNAAIARARELRASLPGANPDGTADPSAVNPDAGDPRGNQLNPPARVVPPTGPTTSLRPQLPGVDASFGFPDKPTGGGSSGGSRSQSDYDRELQSIAEETAALNLEAQALAEVAGKRIEHGDALEYARTRAELLSAAQRSGVADTPALRAQIEQLATEYVKAANSADLAAERIQEVQEASAQGANSIANVFEQMATGALTAEQAVGQLILQILKLSLKKRLLESASGAGGSVFGSFLTLLGGGFANGGFTGRGGKYEPAGIVHKGEYVMSKAATSAIGVGTLDQLHRSAQRGYADGGLVGRAANVSSAPNTSSSGSGEASQAITINAPVTVNGSAGTPEQNADLAKHMGRQMEATMRGVVVQEITAQMRPGNMLNRAGTRR
ncbi:phage tail tape measure protein [Tateyamaria sp. SN3-11]|uniref:phage tail tape measure protein n=1 Tax=Tateyamaria sp. SN3-11 TaxID=3092147 RepID=UPI0039EBB061